MKMRILKKGSMLNRLTNQITRRNLHKGSTLYSRDPVVYRRCMIFGMKKNNANILVHIAGRFCFASDF